MFEAFANWLVYTLIGMDPASTLGGAVQYFIYGVSKIFVMMASIVFVVSFARSFFPPHKIKEILSHEKWGISHLTAALFGAISPFCSCSSIPIFIGLAEAEVPLGVAFAFLVTSPLVNEIAFGIMGATFGWKIAFIYAGSGILLGVVAGLIMGKLGMQKELLKRYNGEECTFLPTTLKGRIKFSAMEVWDIVKRMYLFIIGGVALGAIIHGYVPAEFFAQYIGKGNWFAVPFAVFVGIPIYAGCSTVVPVIFAIATKGVPLGTALAFMMSIAGLSLPEALILKGSMSMRLLTIFYIVVAIGIILIGYLFNIIL
ncbi:MAG: permease [Candidatus Margulisbacteria bacterium]|nr:permease [Candidatus Margulisiibacteriota bacterium]MBU1021145.1 permease [Candidatus Margulisiibacteriota bacterium]MBU1729751.1 permease [Candidatus Margulisiibacteriota bacterium]MBU1955252.1 permease [Candidatus Margulisiibacteriota bacterium]